MKISWKWILGILAILIMAAGLFGLGFAFVYQHQMMANISQGGYPHPQMGPGSMHGGFPSGMMSPRNGPMTEMRGFGRNGHFAGGMFFGIFGRLIALALLLLALYVAYQFGKKHNAPVAVSVNPAAPVAIPANHPCPTCGNTVQDDWKHCPNCGEKQA